MWLISGYRNLAPKDEACFDTRNYRSISVGALKEPQFSRQPYPAPWWFLAGLNGCMDVSTNSLAQIQIYISVLHITGLWNNCTNMHLEIRQVLWWSCTANYLPDNPSLIPVQSRDAISHPFIFYTRLIPAKFRVAGGWSLSQLSLSERQGTHWTGRQSIIGSHRDKRDTELCTLTLTPKDNLESEMLS